MNDPQTAIADVGVKRGWFLFVTAPKRFRNRGGGKVVASFPRGSDRPLSEEDEGQNSPAGRFTRFQNRIAFCLGAVMLFFPGR